MTMTSNYDKYIRPETWPIPVTEIGYLFEGRSGLDGMVEIRCWVAPNSERGSADCILGVVPREHVRGAIGAIIAYRNACRKLTG